MKNKTLLIIEDHPALRTSLSSWISELFPTLVVHTAASGEEALDIIDNINPHFAIIDVGLPGMDGFEVSRSLKEINPEVKIVILTIFEGKKYVEESIRAGASAFITKKEMLVRIPKTLTNIFNEPSETLPLN